MLKSLFNKVAGLGPTTLLIKRLCHRYFPVNFLKLLITPPVAVSEIFLLHDAIVRTAELVRMTK